MHTRVLVPWEENRRNAPDELGAIVYDGGDTLPTPQQLAGVELYVVPYWRESAYDLIDKLPALRAVQVLTAGYEHVIDRIPDGVTLCSGRGLHDASTAEHALGLMLASQRDLPRWALDQRRHVWDPERDRSLAGSRVLIVGYGSIGAAIETRLLACEAEVLRLARRARPDQDIHGVEDLHALLPQVDIVVVVTPHTPDTEGLIGARELDLLPDDALVVNVGRGPVLDTRALLDQSGRIRAALDVTDPEPLPEDHPLWDAPGVYITPHVAGGTRVFHRQARRFVDDQVRRWAAGEQLANIVLPGR